MFPISHFYLILYLASTFFKIKEKEAKCLVLQHEVDTLQYKLREAKEESAEKDGQIKLISMNIANVEKQRNMLSDEVTKSVYKNKG